VHRALVLSLVVCAVVALGGTARTAAASTSSPQSRSAVALDPEPLERVLVGLGLLAKSGAVIATSKSLDQAVDALAHDHRLADVQAAVKQLWTSSDFYDKALIGAVCDGMYQVSVSKPSDPAPTWGSWHWFLIDWGRTYIENRTPVLFEINELRAKVNTLTRTWAIAQVSPAEAAVYWRACQ